MSRCSFLGLFTAKAPLNLNTYPLSQHQPHKLHIDKWKMQSFWNNQIVLAKSAWEQRLCFSHSFKTASVIPLQREYSVCASFTAPKQLLWSLCSVYSAKFSAKIKGKLASLSIWIYYCYPCSIPMKYTYLSLYLYYYWLHRELEIGSVVVTFIQ